MNIVGISAFFHESAACLMADGELVAAAAEERFTRVKHDARLPVSAYRYCLEAGGLGPGDVDAVAFYELPDLKADRQRRTGAVAPPGQPDALDPGRPERMIREHLGHDGPILTFPHHLSHAASAFHFSGFEEAAVLTVDGVGEWATATYGYAAGTAVEPFEEVRFPHSLGLFYGTITAYLGFRVNDGEYKVMGLAPYGEPRLAGALRSVVRSGPGGQFTLDMDCFDFVERMWSDRLGALLGIPPRQPAESLGQEHADLAASAQLVLEELLLEKVDFLAGRVGGANLCMAGGVALNSVANGRILREGPFDRLFVQPAAGDDGGSVGAAALAHVALTGGLPRPAPLRRVDLGPSYPAAEIDAVLRGAGLDADPYRPDDVAARLAAGQVVGWFAGGMEFGPRALGARSILGDPRSPGMQRTMNLKIKFRESFRPFAPSVLAERIGDYFDLDRPSPYMLLVAPVRAERRLPAGDEPGDLSGVERLRVPRSDVPAVTHVDYSARIQSVDRRDNPDYYDLIAAFEARTGCGVVVNTSFNVRGEPIVCTPRDAYTCFMRTDMDVLVAGPFILDKADQPAWVEETDWREEIELD